MAKAVDQRPALDAALAAGLVNAEQAQVIANTIRDLPADVDDEVRGKAEAALIDRPGSGSPPALRKIGEQILAYVAPELAEAADAAALARMEARARQTRAFHLSRNGDGRVRLTGWLDEEGAATVNAALDPLCAPRHDEPGGEPRTPAQRRADALVEICELATRTQQLPDSGGERPHVVITVPFDLLVKELGVGTLDTGERLSPEQVRRLACDAQLIPAVLGGDGQVLDLGRTRRLITGALRRALELRDGGCAFPGCDRPPRWCHGHHVRAWSDGGSTTLDNSVLLCGYHHRIIHRGHWSVRIAADGMPEFIPPSMWTPAANHAATATTTGHRLPRMNARLRAALAMADRAFAGVPRVGAVDGCTYCYAQRDLDLLGGDPALVPDDLVGMFAREVTDHWSPERYGVLWRGLAPRILRMAAEYPESAMLPGLLRGPGTPEAGFGRWPPAEQDALVEAFSALLAWAVVDWEQPHEVVELFGPLAGLYDDIRPWFAQVDALTGVAADAGVVRLMAYWAVELLDGRGPPWSWWPADPVGLATAWVCSAPVRERVVGFAERNPGCANAAGAVAVIEALASRADQPWEAIAAMAPCDACTAPHLR